MVALRDALRRPSVEGLRVQGWTGVIVATVAWPADRPIRFFNVNTVEDLAEAERLAT